MTIRGQLWAVVLAGGEGRRLWAFTRRLYGQERPKQYAVLVGTRSLLRQTLDRVALAVSAERTIVVTKRSHAPYIATEFARPSVPQLLVQPEDRGTAAGILLPAHWIHRRDPEATVAVFPSDHFILEEAAFMDHVTEVAAFVGGDVQGIVLLGAPPTEPETDYGWIEPGEPVGQTRTGPVWRVARFWEKPSSEVACSCLARGCLWNTLIIISKVSALIEAGRHCLPKLHDRLAHIAPFLGTDDEPWAIQQAYALAPKANFSRSILEHYPPSLSVSRLPAITWSDWGTPDRILESLRRAGASALWLTQSMTGQTGLPPGHKQGNFPG